MSLATMIFDCPPAKWQAIRRALAEKKIDVPDEMSGELVQDYKGKNVIVAFRRDGDTLTVDLLTNPTIYPLWMIKIKVRKLFSKV